MKTLVLAEKPSVAKELARVLGSPNKQKSYYEGPRYVVTWALGHLVTLAEPEDYSPAYKTWKLEDLPLVPERMKLKVIKETSHQYRAIEQLCKRKDIGELVIATDAGREGELVARWIMEMVHWRKPFKRLWISSQTDRAIREGFEQLKPGEAYNRLYQSAVCRAEADWLIGLNITRALTTKYDAQLSAGRVQTPTLAMLIRRETEIRQFRPAEYWTLTADLGSFQVQWRHRGTNDARLFDQEGMNRILEKLGGKPARVASVKKTEKAVPPPLAYDLTELQRDANKRYGFSAKQTSNLLQRLYEQYKLVTYPRTDSRYLPSDMAATFKSRLQSVQTGPYAPIVRDLLRKPLPITKRIVDDSKVSDHHAIIPTEQPLLLHLLSTDERRLYDLIVRRFLALFAPPSRYDQTAVQLEIGGELFTASGQVVKEEGWKAVYGAAGWDDQDEEDRDPNAEEPAAVQKLPELTVNETLAVRKLNKRSQMTRPPARLTEAGLLTHMEKHNLGTPATRADIIEKLLGSDTIERQGSHLSPTGKGWQLIELVAEELRSPELTAEWERQLEQIAKGSGAMETFLAGIRREAERMVREVKASEAVYKPHNLTGKKCPDCGEPLLERNTKRGKLLACSSRDCSYRRDAEPPVSNRRCPQCHKKMELHTGKAGKYVQCRRCNIVETLSSEARSGKASRAMLKEYTDNKPIGNSLGDALRAALEKKE
ncbi:DNA topoisomerase III [Paenibacillus sp. J31TS4]|uniref:DNA topoisomerase III n=1 Tax=Paenibacillus sp. J31TS4 TaxID=2807195 RepID=UPI001B057462|nr:DNA topoisomerase III [Paenibacillus sp. J31TS4]GIP38075.1 DNA topoisomerase III [Paenibacillus sp. J31TS4]